MPCSGGLGDRVHTALASVGVTPERVGRWLGRECGCRERVAKLNQLGTWARRILAGKRERAREYLDAILSGE